MDGMVFAQRHSEAGRAPLETADGCPPDRSHRVVSLVRHEIIPRLLLARRGDGAQRRPGPAHVETLARLAMARDPSAAGAQIVALREAGVPHEALLEDLIAPAARRMGDLWTSDAADFVEVALGAGRLCAAVRQLGAQIEPAAGGAAAPLALIATPGRERHGLGALIVAQTFRLAGWRVREAPGAEPESLAAQVAAAPYDLVGLSLSTLDHADAVRSLIARLRRAARGRRIVVALGGPACRSESGVAAALGADFAAADARSALSQAQRHLSESHGAAIKG